MDFGGSRTQSGIVPTGVNRNNVRPGEPYNKCVKKDANNQIQPLFVPGCSSVSSLPGTNEERLKLTRSAAVSGSQLIFVRRQFVRN